MEGFELGEGASYGKIISGLVSVGDGRPEGMWDVDDCMLRANSAQQTLPRALQMVTRAFQG